MSIKDNILSVDNEACVRCGICTTACPSGALEMDGLTDAELLDRLNAGAEGKSLFLGCTLGPDKENCLSQDPQKPKSFAVLPCLAILKESHLISLILSGVSEVGLDCSRCRSCPFLHGKNTIEKTVFHAEALLSGIGCPDRVKIHVSGNGRPDRKKNRKKVREISPGPEYSRRELFTFFKDKAMEKAAERVFDSRQKGLDEDSGGGGLPERRIILIEALRKSDIRDTAAIKEGEFPAHRISIGEGCVMCRRCEAFCPTGALKRVEEAAHAGIEFQMNLCMGCRQCMEFCPAGAIRYENGLSLKAMQSGEVMTLMKKQRTVCSRCGDSFFPEVAKDGCPTCRKRKVRDDKILTILFGRNKDAGKLTGC